MIGDLINLLKSDATLRSYLDTRLYPVHLTQDAVLPAVSLTITENNPNHTKTETSNDDFVELDVKVFARSAYEAYTIANSVRRVLDNYTGTQGSTQILACRFDGFNMSHYPPDDIYETTTEFVLHHRRT